MVLLKDMSHKDRECKDNYLEPSRDEKDAEM